MMKRNNKRSKTRLMDLPIEILIDILNRLPVKSVCCISCVSKTLSDIVYSPFFLDLHSRFHIPTNSLAGEAPQLVLRYAHSKWVITERKITTLLETLNYEDVDDGEGDHTLSDVILYYSDVVFVFYDLIFYGPGRGESGDCCLINPFCGEILRIPTSNILSTKFGEDLTISNSYGMGFDNITGTYKIIRVSQVNKKESLDRCHYVAQVLVLGTSSWREVPLPFSSVPYSNKSVCAYGDMHWLMDMIPEAEDQIQMVTFDSRREEFYLTSTPVRSDRYHSMQSTYLITLGKSIAIVDTYARNMEIWVMKDYSKKEWNLEHIIMLGLDDHFRIVRANCCEMEYGIYFLDDTATVLLFVDLRPSSMKCMSFSVSKKHGWGRIFSLKRSLISLKKFGNLVENPKKNV